jgi:hypothetical protein
MRPMRTGRLHANPEAIMAVSNRTWRWLRQGRPAGLGWRHRMAYAWNAFWFDVNWKLQEGTMGEMEAMDENGPGLRSDPVFILGLWRSGTSFAHELLSACPGLIAPSTRQCMNASTFALVRRHARGASALRPMDGMEIYADSPQEDEFALLALGVPTVYRAFLDPARIEELERLLCPDYWAHEAPPGWGRVWLDFLRCVQRQGRPQGQDGYARRLALKSPGHSFRVKAIERFFPTGRHLWITRSPHDLLHSNRKMWTAMFARYGLSPAVQQRLDGFLLQAFRQAASCLDWMCAHVGRDRLVVVDFDRLTADPAGVIAAAGARLGLGDVSRLREACEAAGKEAARQRSSVRREPYPREGLSASADQVLAALGDAQHRALASHGVAD